MMRKEFWSNSGPSWTSRQSRRDSSPITAKHSISFYRLRSLAHNLKPKWLGHLETTGLMRVLFPFGSQFRNKNDVPWALGIQSANGLTGKHVAERLWPEGRLDEIVEHCRDDVRRQWEPWKRMRGAGMV